MGTRAHRRNPIDPRQFERPKGPSGVAHDKAVEAILRYREANAERAKADRATRIAGYRERAQERLDWLAYPPCEDDR